jgi:NTE family protein
MEPIRTLILSGGGGRGAFHAGVYKYLCQPEKSGVDTEHQAAWSPDIIVGTSIGAVNGAAIAQGISADDLERVWRSLRERDIQGLPPGMRRTARWISNLVLRQFIGVSLPTVATDVATSPPPQDSWLPLPLWPKWLAERLIGRWNNLLDTGPLKSTLEQKLAIDPQKITQSPKTLLITATNVRTGERVTFSNRTLVSRRSGEPRKDVIPGITIQRILASCSIPLVYPWTTDEETSQVFWDGAVVANTPLSGALDAAQDWPIETPMEVLVVLMTPWIEQGQLVSSGEQIDTLSLPLPRSFSEALAFTLDWALLATFRERLRITEAYNELGRMSPVPLYRQVKVVVVAPSAFYSVARIIDYDERTDMLIQQGYEAARSSFQRHFPQG